ncbi:hypothetical protein IAG43_34060 (plasmid) [Streptomyces genisteinicus]|uniref:Uncharacterized protein n=1 Tax=Streptomyces genisteinicus TaxID=2768068 RepID=A0A7H0I5C3_9ACTN|nr:hypothetical protein IAG43_34060 [Streptomyces genisteinicus]
MAPAGRGPAPGPCRYVGEWVATKFRWNRAVDDAELATLEVYGETCAATVVNYTPAP